MADKKPGDGPAEKLRRYWLTGEGGTAKIVWNTPGDWTRCVKQLSSYMTRDEAEGYCQNLHKAATGRYTGDASHRDGR
jgi:hypothetical protein